jgi:hypothetical protein
MEQLVIVLVIAAVSLVKWLMEKSAEQRSRRETGERVEELERQHPRQQRPAPPIRAPRPVASAPVPDMEEAARRLREALGLPADSEPPRTARRASAPPPVPSPEEVSRALVPPAAPPARKKQPDPAKPSHPAHTPAHSRAHTPAQTASPARDQLEQLLRRRDGLRQVMLAREILGPPKGLEI